MNNLFKIFFIFILLQTLGLAAIAQKSKAKIVFTDRFNSILNCYINLEYFPIEVRNKVNSLAVKAIEIDKPTQLFYSIANLNHHKNERQYFSILVLPEDSVVFGKDGIIQSGKGYNKYTDSLISMELAYPTNESSKFIIKNGLDSFFHYAESSYRHNISKIRDLSLNEEQQKALLDFNYIIKCTILTSIEIEGLIGKKEIEKNKIIDSIYSEIIINHKKLNRVNSPFVTRIYHKLISYYLNKKGVDPSFLWSNLHVIADLPFFKQFLISSMYSLNYIDFKELEIIYNKISSANFFDNELRELYFNLKNKKADFTNISLTDISNIFLQDINNNNLSLETILNRNKNKLILIDFWASWCAPCRIELPALKEAKKLFKDKNIAFINISIDEDSKQIEWRNALREDKEATNPNQYRLINWRNSPLTKLLELRIIPRYILLNSKGNVLNREFYKPSDTRFKDALQQYLEVN